jgi:hypothetical protein
VLVIPTQSFASGLAWVPESFLPDAGGAGSGKEAAVTGPEIRVNPALVSPGLLSLFRRQVPRGQFEICTHLDSSSLASSMREH